MVEREVFSCASCTKVFMTRSRFNQHLKTHSKPWKCEICCKGFGLRADLNRHANSKHRVGHQLYDCEKCKRKFTRKDNLTHHIKTHHTTSSSRTTKSSSYSNAINQTAEPVPDWLLLTRSASNGNVSYVERCIHSGCDVNMKADDGCTALHCAARSGQADVLKVLIQCGAEINATNDKSRFPIYEAIIGGHLDCVLLLLEAGTSLEELFWSSYSAQAAFPEHAVRTGDVELLKAILAATPATQRLAVVLRLLKAAAKIGQVDILHHLQKSEGTALENGREYVDRISRQELLHYAVRNGRTAAIEYLLPYYQAKETLSRHLTTAAKAGRADVCKVLLAHSPSIRLDRALYKAAEFGRLPVIEALLNHESAAGADRTDLGEPMLAALWNDRLDSLRYLVSYDARIAQPDDGQYAGLSRVELVKCMLHSGRLKMNDGAMDHRPEQWQNGTLLHLAAEHNDLDLARCVLEHESLTPSILDNDCWRKAGKSDVKTALDLAQFHGHTEIANLLIAHGATNSNIAPKEPPRTEQIPAQPPIPKSDGDHEMQDSSDSDTDTDIDSDS